MPLAEQDLEAAYDYIQQDSENAAKQLVARIFSAVGILTRHPLAGREGRVQGTRELAVARTPYVIAYRIRQDEIRSSPSFTARNGGPQRSALIRALNLRRAPKFASSRATGFFCPVTGTPS